MDDIRREIKKWRKRFRHVLKGWTVTYNPNRKEKRRVLIDSKHRRATICAFGERKVPADYVLHEMIHVCVAVLRRDKYASWKEELFVREICRRIKPA